MTEDDVIDDGKGDKDDVDYCRVKAWYHFYSIPESTLCKSSYIMINHQTITWSWNGLYHFHPVYPSACWSVGLCIHLQMDGFPFCNFSNIWQINPKFVTHITDY